MRNIAADPRVSVGVFAPLTGLASSRGARLFGEARVLPPEHPDREHYWPAFRWENQHAERGRSLAEPPADGNTPHDVAVPDRCGPREATLTRTLLGPDDVLIDLAERNMGGGRDRPRPSY